MHYTPRAILIDTEDRVVKRLQSDTTWKNFFNPDNIFVDPEGAGAGNNWASGKFEFYVWSNGVGYALGEKSLESVIEKIQREADSSDSLEVRCCVYRGLFPLHEMQF